MKILKMATVILFAVTLGIFVWFYVDTRVHSDETYPSIQVDGQLLELSIHDGTEKLLEGVTAFDEKDGDITSRVMVESISQFTEKGVCTVTYAVADSDRHVAKNSRKIYYTDYTSPRFTMKQALVFTVGTSFRAQSFVGATDCIDGDISDKVVVAATDYQANSAGVFSLSLQVANSKGDVIYLDIPVIVEEKRYRAPVIELSEYLIYVSKGETPDFEAYVSSVTSSYANLDGNGVLISEDFDAKTPGVYSIHYYALDELGNEGHNVLTVVVEE